MDERAEEGEEVVLVADQDIYIYNGLKAPQIYDS